MKSMFDQQAHDTVKRYALDIISSDCNSSTKRMLVTEYCKRGARNMGVPEYWIELFPYDLFPEAK